MDMVEIILGLLRSSREGDFLLHLASTRAMIPWCFSYDRMNYARYLPFPSTMPIYVQSWHRPPSGVYAHFMQGGFSVQLGGINPFGKIPVDQTIEETINKDTQTPGGTKGFNLKHDAVQKYYLNAEYSIICLRQLREVVGLAWGLKVESPRFATNKDNKG